MKKFLEAINQFDRKAMYGVMRLHAKPLTYFLRVLTYTGYGFAWFGLAAIVWFLNLRQIYAIPEQILFLECMLAPLIAWGVGHACKLLIRRRRPNVSIENFAPLTRTPIDHSFPSNHTSAAFAFFVSLAIHGHPFAPYVGVWAFLVSFSRFYLGVHFPSDLLGGLVLGVLSALVAP